MVQSSEFVAVRVVDLQSMLLSHQVVGVVIGMSAVGVVIVAPGVWCEIVAGCSLVRSFVRGRLDRVSSVKEVSSDEF